MFRFVNKTKNKRNEIKQNAQEKATNVKDRPKKVKLCQNNINNNNLILLLLRVGFFPLLFVEKFVIFLMKKRLENEKFFFRTSNK